MAQRYAIVASERPMPADFPTAVRAFEAGMVAGGLAATTRHAYRRELVNFVIDWCVLRDVDLVSAPRSEINAYLAQLPSRGSKRGDASRALKAFYSFLAGDHRVDNPAEHVKIPRGKLTPAPHLDPADARALLRAAFRHEPRRGWAMLLALHTGARVSSLVAVTAADVDLERGSIYFRVAKGDRPYSVPLDRVAALACRNLIAEGYETLLGVGAARFRQWVHAAEQSAGIDRVWPHLLRHQFSNDVARHGDPEAWRRLLNHADLSQWSRYVHAGDERLRAVLPGS